VEIVCDHVSKACHRDPTLTQQGWVSNLEIPTCIKYDFVSSQHANIVLLFFLKGTRIETRETGALHE
jgi:hypothetical protein